jgi:hypothetical protein
VTASTFLDLITNVYGARYDPDMRPVQKSEGGKLESRQSEPMSVINVRCLDEGLTIRPNEPCEHVWESRVVSRLSGERPANLDSARS